MYCKFQDAYLLATLLILLELFGLNNGDGSCKYEKFLQPGIEYAIKSPGYPEAYANESGSCEWALRTTWDQRVKIECNDVNIPSNWYCGTDRLEIRDGVGRVERFCSRQQFPYTSESSRLTVTLRTFPNKERGSFNCTAEAVKLSERDCGKRNVTKTRAPDGIGSAKRMGNLNEYPFMVSVVTTAPEIPVMSSLTFHQLQYEREWWILKRRGPQSPRYRLTATRCGGTIINKKQVLTAAHCVYDFKAGELGVIVKEKEVRNVPKTLGQHFMWAKTAIVHPSFRAPGQGPDIAIITIKNVFQFDETISPVCLPPQSLRNSLDAVPIEMLGWGISGSIGYRQKRLNRVKVTVPTTETCKFRYPEASDQEICTLRASSETCELDTGGPVIYQSEESRKIVQIAIVTKKPTCYGNDLELNLGIQPFVDWIVEHAPRGIDYCIAH